MTFEEVLDQAIAMLQRKGRVSYRALKLQFQIGDEFLDALKEELIDVHQLAVDHEGKMLLWSGETPDTPEPSPVPPTSVPTPSPAARDPLSYTPQHLTEKILPSRSALEGERKQVTVCFADLKDSTELIRDLDPEDAQRLLDPAIHIMMDAVHRFEGTVNQVLGDGIMALFGAPSAHEDHAARACSAALAMQAAMQPYADAMFRTHGIPMQIRVGLNSGGVVVRTIGNDLHMDYSAARGLTKFVGRETEIEARNQARERAAAGNGQLVAAVGEAGVGKSRLVYEFMHSHRTRGWLMLETASESYGQATPYVPVVDLLKRYVHVEDGDDPRTIRAQVTGQLLTLDESLAEAVPLVEEAVAQAVSIGRIDRQALRVATLSDAHLHAGHVEAASTLAEQALDLSRTYNERGNEAYALRLLGDIAMHHNPPEIAQAETHYHQALALTNELGMRPLQAHCHRGLSTMYRQIGQSAQAQAELALAVEMYRSMERTSWLP